MVVLDKRTRWVVEKGMRSVEIVRNGDYGSLLE